MDTLQKKVSDVNVIAIVKPESWYPKESLKKSPFWITKDCFIVVSYFEYEDGYIEGKTSIAICRDIDDALLIFNNKEF